MKNSNKLWPEVRQPAARIIQQLRRANGILKLAQSKSSWQLKLPAIDGLRKLYHRGVASGTFRSGLDMIDLHLSISALSVFNVANRHTFSLIFQRELESPAALIARRDSVLEMVVRFVRK